MIRPREAAALVLNPGPRREPAREHLRNALQALMNLLDTCPTLSAEDRRDVRAAVHRLWLALRELDAGNV